MGAGRLDTVRAIYDAMARGDFTTSAAHFAPEIRFETVMPDSTGRYVATGAGGIAVFMREFLQSWTQYRLVGERFEELDENTILVEGFQDARGRYSGAVVRDEVFGVWTFEGDRVVRILFELDREAALRAAR